MYLRAGLVEQDLLEQDFIVVQNHDLRDVLCRIGMSKAVHKFQRLLVRLNPLVDAANPEFLDEVWGVFAQGEQDAQDSVCCLYSASAASQSKCSRPCSNRCSGR